MRIDFWKSWFEPKPFNSGYLPEDEGHQVFFAEYGNPKGKPILVFHGGPGGSFKPKHIAFANLKKYRVIGFDQRGCGQSLPNGETSQNTAAHLLKDAERLLDYLGISEKVILRGGSWGATLALLFAESYPERVEKMLLSQIFLADKYAREWEFEGMKNFYPEFVEELHNKAKEQDVAIYFATEIASDDPARQLEAMNFYGFYERLCGSLTPHWGRENEVDSKALASNRVYMFYAMHRFMLKDLQIIKHIANIRDIPVIIVHNRLDFVCPVYGAYLLHKKLPKSKLVIVPSCGHVSDLLYKTINKVFAEELNT